MSCSPSVAKGHAPSAIAAKRERRNQLTTDRAWTQLAASIGVPIGLARA